MSADWYADAACRGMSPVLFFPDDGEPVAPEAKAVCAACPVRAECLAVALDAGERHGLWGGMTVRQREQLRTRRPAAHGTRAKYAGGCRCEPCREANRAYVQQRRAS